MVTRHDQSSPDSPISIRSIACLTARFTGTVRQRTENLPHKTYIGPHGIRLMCTGLPRLPNSRQQRICIMNRIIWLVGVNRPGFRGGPLG